MWRYIDLDERTFLGTCIKKVLREIVRVNLTESLGTNIDFGMVDVPHCLRSRELKALGISPR